MRYDGSGCKKHYNDIYGEYVESPHVHDPLFPGGVRSAESWEIP